MPEVKERDVSAYRNPLTKAEKAELKSLAESGIPLREIAARTGLDYERIRKACQRGGWLIPKTVERVAKEQLSRTVPRVPKALDFAGETLQLRQNHLREQTHALANRLISNALDAADSGQLSVESVKDAVDIVKLARLNLDMSTGEAAPALNVLFSGSYAASNSAVAEAEFDEPVEALDAEWSAGCEGEDD